MKQNRIPNIRCFSSIEKTRIIQNMRSFLRPSQSVGNYIGSLKEASLRSEREREGGKECIKRKRKSTTPKDCMSYCNNKAYLKETKHMSKSCAVCYSYTDHLSDTSLIKNETKNCYYHTVWTSTCSKTSFSYTPCKRIPVRTWTDFFL